MITTKIYLRCVSLIYFLAFLTIYNDYRGLIGEEGLTPAYNFVQRLRKIRTDFIGEHPTVFMYLDPSNENLHAVISMGIITSVTSIFYPSKLLFALLWVVQLSIVNIGQIWYSFGWESQLLEIGFLAILISPLNGKVTRTSYFAQWSNRLLLFKIMLGSGLIKIRGDPCWRNLTCMNYHYETQPVPNQISYYLHFMPNYIHGIEVIVNHFVELIVPFMILSPFRKGRILAGKIQIGFQFLIILGGNLSFLNWLTIIPAIYCFDDEYFGIKNQKSKTKVRNLIWDALCAMFILYLSIDPFLNLISSQQAMNTSYDRFRIVNSYGAFGSVGSVRKEIIIFGSNDSEQWKEYQFKCKPSDEYRKPCQISPYHYRLDWLAWFAGFSNYQHQQWTVNLAYQLMNNQESALQLLSNNPFPDKPPQFIKIDLYHYEFGYETWWQRKYMRNWLPIVSQKELEPYLKEVDLLPRYKVNKMNNDL